MMSALRLAAGAALCLALVGCGDNGPQTYTVTAQRFGFDGKPMPAGGGYPFIKGVCAIRDQNGLRTEEILMGSGEPQTFTGTHISCTASDEATDSLSFELTIARGDGRVLGTSRATGGNQATVAGS